MFSGRRLRHATCSVPGRRKDNEDRASTLSVGREFLVAVVADGMGGANAGAVASEEAIRGFLGVARTCSVGGETKALKNGFASADGAIRNAAQPGREGMGTTLVAAITRGKEIWVGNIGDSRAVLVLPDEVIPLSADHSFVGDALRAGEISEVEALAHPYRHVVSRAIGDGDAGPELHHESLRERPVRGANAFIVLGTDGLFNHIGDADLLDVAATSSDVQILVRKLVLRAIQNGSDDNVTAAALLLPGDEPSRIGRAVALLIVLVVIVVVAVVSASARLVQWEVPVDGHSIEERMQRTEAPRGGRVRD